MTDKAIDLDHRRRMAAQKATELRRLLADVAANEKALRTRQDELEIHLLAAPAENWHEAAESRISPQSLCINNHGPRYAPTKADCRRA